MYNVFDFQKTADFSLKISKSLLIFPESSKSSSKKIKFSIQQHENRYNKKALLPVS